MRSGRRVEGAGSVRSERERDGGWEGERERAARGLSAAGGLLQAEPALDVARVGGSVLLEREAGLLLQSLHVGAARWVAAALGRGSRGVQQAELELVRHPEVLAAELRLRFRRQEH